MSDPGDFPSDTSGDTNVEFIKEAFVTFVEPEGDSKDIKARDELLKVCNSH